MRLALKIDVDTDRGTREGVPRLVEALRARGAGATFLFSLGPDHTGRAVRRVFRRGFVGKVARTSVLEHYGLKTLLYGTLLPGPDIGRRGAAQMRAARDAGFEVGVHCWDHVRWQDGVAGADAPWTERELARAGERFAEVFGSEARVHGAAGWQTNAHALRFLDRAGYAFASDTRGEGPFRPRMAGEVFRCPQWPTTLPTLDELIGLDGRTPEDAVRDILARTAGRREPVHVFTAHAELEGAKLLPALAALLAGWAAQGYEVCALGELAAARDARDLPVHEVVLGQVSGRSGTLALQGRGA
ncbi:MAG TPA: polysaccharide deacetylase family protein [Burkholderiales bacterium]|nr:polysaccharide deacetylase family protein [Burkholderiales bacterium]